MVTIASITADWVLDSRATPTVEATVTLDDGTSAFGQAPSGASTGRHESVERRDGDPSHFGGKGVEGAVRAVRWRIAPALTGQEISDQAVIDAALVELDGTEDRSELGANAILAVSVACARLRSNGSATSTPPPRRSSLSGVPPRWSVMKEASVLPRHRVRRPSRSPSRPSLVPGGFRVER
jgi:enolase